MDTDKDGLLSSSDLVAAFTAHGKNIGGGEAQVKNLFPLFVNFVKASILLVKVKRSKRVMFIYFSMLLRPCLTKSMDP